MSDVPCSNYLLDEIDSLLNEDTDDREVTISQGILRKCCWHLYQYKRLTTRVDALEAALEHLTLYVAINGDDYVQQYARKALAATEQETK